MAHDAPLNMTSLCMNTPLRCVVVGDKGVGKTTLLESLEKEQYPTHRVPSVTERFVTPVQVKTRPHFVAMTDTSSDIAEQNTRVPAYDRADICLVCFSVTSPEGLDHVTQTLLPEVRANVAKSTKIILVGMKIDQRLDGYILDELESKGLHAIDTKQGDNIARTLRVDAYLECSAKTQEGVKSVFRQAVALALEPTVEDEKQRNCCCIL